MIAKDHNFINGKWLKVAGDNFTEVTESATGEVIARVAMGGTREADLAVSAARGAFEGWSAMPAKDRSEFARRIQAGLGEKMAEIAELIAREVGMPLQLSRIIQVGLPMNTFGEMARLGEEFAFETREGNAVILREPVGVVAAITPWNYPLHQIAAKVAPALVAGCTVVLKPSEVAPLNAFALAEIIEASGLPPGVFNLVTGTGVLVGEALAAHPDVDMISFTGSTRAGKRVAEIASASVKRVALELGGKSACVILDDADFERAVPDGVSKCFLNSGQTCSALTRLLVPTERLKDAERLAVAAAETYTLGDPLERGARMGPLVSEIQRQRVRGYIDSALSQGAKLLTGGGDQPPGFDAGYFVSPTILSDVTPEMTVAQEEIFGPVLCLMAYSDEKEALEIANGTIYGLAGGVWSGSQERAINFARKMRTGQVEINGGAFNPNAPFGGYKQSGNGRELGHFGLEEFLETKALLT